MRNLGIVCALVLVCVHLVYSGSCTACRKGLPRHDCTDKYYPPSPYVIDEGLCKNIREKRSGGNSEEMNLFKMYGGNYQILCELDDLSEIYCVGDGLGVYSGSCTACRKGLPRDDCTDKYYPPSPYVIDKGLCENIREKRSGGNSEEMNLFKRYGGNYQILCELDDLSEISCAGVWLGVYSGSCTACRKGLPRHDCTDKYYPPSPYVIDEGLCKNIREKRSGGNSEEMNLFKRYGGNYQILCELDDLSEIYCAGVWLGVYSGSCTACRKGLPRHDCTDKYNPPSPYVIDEGLCENIREKRSGGNSEEMNLFKRYGGNYQILCELDDLSQISCVGVRVVPSRRVGGGGRGGSPAHQVCLLLLVVGVLSSLVL